MSTQINDTTAGYQVGGAASEKISFHGVTPVIMRVGANQTALTDSTGGSVSNATLAAGVTLTAVTDNSTGSATSTIAAATNTQALTDNSGGTPATTIAVIADAATANAVASIAVELATQRALNTVLINAVASLAAKINTTLTDLGVQNSNDAKIAELANELRAALVEKGLIKGSA